MTLKPAFLPFRCLSGVQSQLLTDRRVLIASKCKDNSVYFLLEHYFSIHSFYQHHFNMKKKLYIVLS